MMIEAVVEAFVLAAVEQGITEAECVLVGEKDSWWTSFSCLYKKLKKLKRYFNATLLK